MDMDEVTEFDSQVVAGNLVHLDPAFTHVIGAQTDEDGIFPFFSSIEKSCIYYEYCGRRVTHRTMMVSPRKRERTSIVTGLRVATTHSKKDRKSGHKLTRVVV